MQCGTAKGNFKLADFDGNGRADLLLRDSAGTFSCSTDLNDDGVTELATVNGLPESLEWHVAVLTDLDGDGNTDLLLRHRSLGWSLAPFDGCSLKGERQAAQLNDLQTESRIVGIIDIDGDEKDELLVRTDNGAWSVIFLDGTSTVNVVDNPNGLPVDNAYRVIGVGDFDGDRMQDILTRHVDGAWYLHTHVDNTGTEFSTRSLAFQTGSDWRDEMTADFDGDAQQDILLRHATGSWEVQTLNSDDPTSIASWQPSQISSAWHWRAVASGDLDADGRDELVLYKNDTNQWFYTTLSRTETSDNEPAEFFNDVTGDLDLPRAPLYFPDLALRVLLERTLELEPGEWISARDLRRLKSMTHIAGRGEALPHEIGDLRGLRAAHGLTELDLGGHAIKTTAPLIGLNLRSLDLEWNQLEDIGALVGMTELTDLDLRVNSVSDLSSLAPLIKLERLELSSNAFTDLSPLGQLNNLEYLQLSSNNIVDIAPLATLTRLRELYLAFNRIEDLSPLAQLKQLQRLFLRFNAIADLEPLASLTNLTSLDLTVNAISDLAPLESLTSLDYLLLGGNEISDITPLASLTNLRYLNLSHNDIASLVPLESLTRLENLNLTSNEIVDVSSLSNLTNLVELQIADNAVADISPLARLTRLEYLDLASNDIADIQVLLSLEELDHVNLDFNPLSDAAKQDVIPELRERGVEVASSPLLVFRDSRGRSVTWVFDDKAATAKPNGLLIYFHGNVTASSRGAVTSRFRRTTRLAQEQGLVGVVIASPEAWSLQKGWREPNLDGDGKRFWNYHEDVDLIHEMLQTDFGGLLAVDSSRLFFHGSSQGTCFLHPFLNRWGQHYRGGLLADCGCVDVNLDPIWHADPQTIANFRVFVRAPTGDFLHTPSRLAHDYYKHILGFETYGDLSAEGGHCFPGDVSDSDALAWLTSGSGLEEHPPENPHFSRVSLADRIVGLATDANGALWFVQQERTGDDPSASLWRSVDRGKSFELAGRHPFEVYDLDTIGDALFLTTKDGPIRRSIDMGRTFEDVMVDAMPAVGWVRDYQANLTGWPYVGKRPGLISTRSGSLLLLPELSDSNTSEVSLLVSDDLGRSWRTEQTPLQRNYGQALGPDPLVLDGENSYLQLSDPVGWFASDSELQWYPIDDPPSTLVSAAWNGTELFGYRYGENGRTWWSASGPGGIWREKTWPNTVTDVLGRWRAEQLTAIDHGDVLLFGSGSEGHLYNGLEDIWTQIKGGTFLSRGVHRVAVDTVRGDVFISGGRGLFRLDAHFRHGSQNITPADDRDNDEVPDTLDQFPDDATEYQDTDLDGIGNEADEDDDGDGVADDVDAMPLDREEYADLDRDGIGDRTDNDRDGDGFRNQLDEFPLDRTEIEDTDADGIGDWNDSDDDNDGALDVDDAFPKYAFEHADQDGDFIGDRIDPDPSISTLESHLQLTVAHGPWYREGTHRVQLNKDAVDGVIYPELRGDTRFYGRLSLGDEDRNDVNLMVSIFDGDSTQHVYFDRNGDHDLTNDGGPVRTENGRSNANWHDIWIEVSYRSGITLPYHISAYRFRLEGRTKELENMWVHLPPSGRATRATFPNGLSVSLAVVDANGNAIFNDDADYVCADINGDTFFDGCGTEGTEHFPYGDNIVLDEVSYAIESAPSGYMISIKTVEDSASMVSRAENLATLKSIPNELILDERDVTLETFYSPPGQKPVKNIEKPGNSQ